MDNNKVFNKKHKNLNPSFDIFNSQISQKTFFWCVAMLTNEVYTFIRFGECTTIQQYDHFSAFYTMRNALEEIITWHFMTIVALPENFHYPILHNAKINV